MSGLIAEVQGVFSSTEKFISGQWAERMVQCSVYGGLIFYILSTTSIISQVDKTVNSIFNVKLGNEGTRGLHAVVFVVLMYFGSKFSVIVGSSVGSSEGGGVGGVVGVGVGSRFTRTSCRRY